MLIEKRYYFCGRCDFGKFLEDDEKMPLDCPACGYGVIFFLKRRS